GYDAVGNLLWQEAPRAYDLSAARDWSAADPRRVRTSYGYDDLNRRTEVVEAFGVNEGLGHPSPRTVTKYDAVGNVTEVIDPLGRRTHFDYDDLNRPTATYEDWSEAVQGRPRYARRTLTEYDPQGRVLANDRGSGNDSTFAPRQVTDRFRYDVLGRQTESIIAADVGGDAELRALKITTTSTWDAADHVT